MTRLRVLWFAVLVLGFAPVVACVGLASASTTTPYYGSAGIAGECNESVAGVDTTWTNGFTVDVGCSGIVPADGVPGIGSAILQADGFSASPACASWGLYGHTGLGWAGQTLGFRALGGGFTSCGTTTDQDVSTCLGAVGSGVGDTYYLYGGDMNYNYVACSTTGCPAFAAICETMQDMTLGPVFLGSDGTHYRATTFYYSMQFPAAAKSMASGGVANTNGCDGASVCPVIPIASGSAGYVGGACDAVTAPPGTSVYVQVAVPAAKFSELNEVSGGIIVGGPTQLDATGSPWSAPEVFQVGSLTCSPTSPVTAPTAIDHVKAPSLDFTGESAPAAHPCTLASVSGPTAAGVVGVQQTFTVSVVGGGDQVAIDPNDGATPTTTWNSTTLGADAVVKDLGPDGTVTISVTPTAASGDYVKVYCSSGGLVQDLSGIASPNGYQGPPTASGGGSFDVSSCFAAAGWSLTDPVSWVTGALHDATCVIEWLFIPTGSSLSGFEQVFGIGSNAPSGSAPVSEWLGSVGQLLSTGPAATVGDITSAASGGSCNTLGFGDFTAYGHTVGFCSMITSVKAHGASGIWVVVDDILTAGVLVGFFFLLLWFLRKVLFT